MVVWSLLQLNVPEILNGIMGQAKMAATIPGQIIKLFQSELIQDAPYNSNPLNVFKCSASFLMLASQPCICEQYTLSEMCKCTLWKSGKSGGTERVASFFEQFPANDSSPGSLHCL